MSLEQGKTRAPGEAAAVADEAARRRREGRTNVTLASLLVLAILAMLNYLSFRHYRRWDWTSEGVFTLSERTRQVTRALDADVDVYLVMSSAEANYQDLRELLGRYRAESQHVVLHFIDPDRAPSEYQLVAERFHLGAAMLADGSVGADVAVVMVSGERQWEITRDDLVSFDFDAYAEEGATRVDVRSEQALTGGLLEVTSGRDTKVCVTTGHGEWTLDASSERDLSGLRDEMRRENLALETVETRGLRALPEDCDAVFVVGPTLAFTPEEAGLLRDHVRRGGNVFVALDPVLERGEIASNGLEDVLRELGVRVDRTVVLELDAAHLSPNQPSPVGPFLVTDYGEHEISRGFGALEVPTVLNLARSIRLVDDQRGAVLLSASAQSFGETDVAGLVESGEPHRDDADLAGPVPLAVAIDEGADAEGGEAEGAEGAEGDGRHGGRLVVMGDADFLDGGFMSAQDVVNYELASAIIGWLTQREALIAIPPRRVEASPVRMSEGDVFDLAFRVILLMPLAAVFLGLAVWWNRRS